MGTISWDDMAEDAKTSSGGGNNNKYMKLESGKKYKVRPVGRPVRFFKYFRMDGNRVRSAICANPDACPVKAKYPDLDKPRRRYAINIIDRTDGNIKILEAGPTVFQGFMAWYEQTGKSPGGKDGGDFGITVKGVGRDTEYGVTFLETKPLTAEENELYNEKKYDLETEYAAKDAEEIEKRLFGKDDDEGKNSKGYSGKNAAKKPQQQEDDDFGEPSKTKEDDTGW